MRTKRFAILVLVVCLFSILTNDAFAFYNPQAGHWLSRDPIAEKGGMNLYAAVENEPVNFIDPVGQTGCNSSYYNWNVHSPMTDRDLTTAQTITVSTMVKIADDTSVVSRSFGFHDLYGLTITEPSLVGGDCCCSVNGTFNPFFELVMHSQIYLLDARSPAWGVNRIHTGDPSVDDYWHDSYQWYRRHLAMNHEYKHQSHGKKNYEKWKATLQAAESNSYPSRSDCLQAIRKIITQSWGDFQINERLDSNALHNQ